MAEETFFNASPDAPSAPTSPGPTVDLETATMGLPPSMRGPAENPALNQMTFGGPPDPEALPRPQRPPQASAVPAQTPPAPPPELISSLQQQLQNVDKRLTDTQAAFHAERERANLLTQQAMQQQQQGQAQAQSRAMAEQIKPPELSAEQLEALVTDPAAVRALSAGDRDYVIRRMEATVGPVVQWAQGASALNAVQQQLLEDFAVDRARKLVTEQDGMTDAQFDELLEPTRALLRQSYSNPVQQAATMLNPEALRWGMRMAATAQPGNQPVRGRAAAPPSPPASSNAPAARTAGGNTAKPMSVRLAEQRLGVPIPREKWENNEHIGRR